MVRWRQIVAAALAVASTAVAGLFDLWGGGAWNPTNFWRRGDLVTNAVDAEARDAAAGALAGALESGLTASGALSLASAATGLAWQADSLASAALMVATSSAASVGQTATSALMVATSSAAVLGPLATQALVTAVAGSNLAAAAQASVGATASTALMALATASWASNASVAAMSVAGAVSARVDGLVGSFGCTSVVMGIRGGTVMVSSNTARVVHVFATNAFTDSPDILSIDVYFAELPETSFREVTLIFHVASALYIAEEEEIPEGAVYKITLSSSAEPNVNAEYVDVQNSGPGSGTWNGPFNTYLYWDSEIEVFRMNWWSDEDGYIDDRYWSYNGETWYGGSGGGYSPPAGSVEFYTSQPSTNIVPWAVLWFGRFSTNTLGGFNPGGGILANGRCSFEFRWVGDCWEVLRMTTNSAPFLLE